MFGNSIPWTLLVSLVIIVNACGSNEKSAADLATERDRSYLEEPVPPCVPTVSEPDPCPVDLPPPNYDPPGRLVTISPVKISSFTDRLIYDEESGVNEIHIVVRGTVKTNTIRCDIYRDKISKRRAQQRLERGFAPTADQYIAGRYLYICFADIAIKEYIFGVGPPTLTVVLDVTVLDEDDKNHFDQNDEEYKERFFKYYGNPEAVATSYEGREIIFFLGPSPSLAVESWAGLGGYNMWFLQQTDQGIRALAQGIWRVLVTEELRNALEEIYNTLDRPLDEMVADVKQAAINRTTITGGRIGPYPDLPMFITDAHNLRDYYISVGAVYDDSDDATVLPPPAPG